MPSQKKNNIPPDKLKLREKFVATNPKNQKALDGFRSNKSSSFLMLIFVALIVAPGARAQAFNETLISSDNAYNPIPSPDGRHIAYVRTGWGEKLVSGFGRGSLVSDVKIVNTEGVPVSKTLAKDYFLSGWTPDSNRLVCYRDWRYALISTEGKQMEEGHIPNDSDLHSASEWVAYSPSLATVIWSRPIDNSHRAIETPSRIVAREDVSWNDRVVPSPDGRYLAVFPESSETNLRIYDLRLKSWMDFGTIHIHPDKDWSYIQPDWNPWFSDGSRLVFLRNSTLVISTPDGNAKKEIKIDGPAGLPVPSPDGKSVAYVSYEPRPMNSRPDLQFWGGTTIWVVPVSGSSGPRTVTRKDSDEVLDLKWLGNDTLVFDRVADEIFYRQARIWKVSVSH